MPKRAPADVTKHLPPSPPIPIGQPGVDPKPAQPQPAPEKADLPEGLGLKPEKADLPEKEFPVPGTFLDAKIAGYEKRRIEGFVVMVSTQAIFEGKKDKGRPFRALDSEFKQLAKVVPPRLLTKLQTVLIWIEWDYVDRNYPYALAQYHAGGLWPRSTYDGMKNDAVELLSLKRLTEEKNRPKGRIVMLHELAHAVHHKVLLFGFDNQDVLYAYRQAMGRRLYDSVKHDDGTERQAYAATNEREYFEEVTCMYLDRCLYYPFERKEMKEYDAAGYKLMEKYWGKVETPAANGWTAPTVNGSIVISPHPKKGAEQPPVKPKGWTAARLSLGAFNHARPGFRGASARRRRPGPGMQLRQATVGSPPGGGRFPGFDPTAPGKLT